jgi:sensor c-di-GMP phosphodiesterase-like protein
LRAFGRHKLFAAALGLVLAAVPAYCFTSWVQEQGEPDAFVAANWSIKFIDLTIDGVAAKLGELADRGIDSCGPANIEALQQAVFAASPIKEMALLAPGGQVLCTNAGSSFASHEVVASAATPHGNVMLDAVRLAGRDDTLLRVRLLTPRRQSALAALVPVDLLLPRVAPDGSVAAGFARVTLGDGTLIGTQRDDTARVRPSDYVSARAQSGRYGPVATITMPRQRIMASADDLRRIGMVVSGMFALSILACAIVIPWRQRRNPVAEIEAALVADQFVPYYQPIIDIRTGTLLGAEVLVRWRRADGTVVAPGTFIPFVESRGLIVDLTRSLMRQVCDEVGVLIGARRSMYIAFNIAPRHFSDSVILNDVGAIFEGSPIGLSQIVLEITERFEIENLTATRRVIAALQALGCRVALDDVGTGHNGLSYILKLGVDIIKIDRLFVEAIKSERHARAIVETLVNLARNLRMQIVAEGVERLDQVQYLRDTGISAAQGYLFAPPLPGSAFIKLVEAMTPPAGEAGRDDVTKAPKDVVASVGRLAAA